MSSPSDPTVYPNEAEWLAARQGGIGSSDAPAILGVSPWSSPFSVWAEKTGKLEPTPGTLRLRVGHALEPLIHDELEAAGYRLEDPGDFAIFHSAEHPWQAATLDRRLVGVPEGEAPPPGGWGPAEFKTIAVKGDDWSEAEPSGYAIVQHHHQMLVTGTLGGVIAGLVGLGSELLVYAQEANPDLLEVICEAELRFWTQHVERDIPPPADGTEQTRRALGLIYPRSSGTRVILPARFAGYRERMQELEEQAKRAREAVEAMKAEVKATMAEAGEGVIEGTESGWTWREVTRKGYTVEPTSYRDFRWKSHFKKEA